MSELLMPKATAVWLVDNTALAFEQIAAFCGLHDLEVQGIADGEVAVGIRGFDPIANGQLARDEIARCEQDSSLRLSLSAPSTKVPHAAHPTPKKPLARSPRLATVPAWPGWLAGRRRKPK